MAQQQMEQQMEQQQMTQQQMEQQQMAQRAEGHLVGGDGARLGLVQQIARFLLMWTVVQQQ